MKTQRCHWTARPLLIASLVLLMPYQAQASDWQETESTMNTTVKEVVVFESCTDGVGKNLPAVADEQQSMLVRTVTESDGSAAIHYNPAVLPRLSQAARLFLYTNECARHGVGGADGKLSIARARVADCRTVKTLIDSALLTRDALPSLQTEMAFSDSEWQQLPGPARRFELTTCQQTRGDVLVMPLNTPPTAQQNNWNGCERACADKLWRCQNGSAGGGSSACLDQHQQCRKACGQAPAAQQTKE